MQKQSCDNCGESFGLNDLISVFDETLCHKCTDSRLENTDPEQNTEETVYRLVDRTICARCLADNGTEEFELFLDMPFCGNCREQSQHYPFPLWVKTACLAVLMIVIFSISYNIRFFKARILMQQSMQLATQEGQYVIVAEKMGEATRLVPESPDVKKLSHFFSGVVEYQKEDFEAAMTHFNQCREMPIGSGIDEMILHTKIAIAFENKEYEEFLRLSKELLESTPKNAITTGLMGSAYACVYAVDGREEDKEKALDFLRQAEALNEQYPIDTFEEDKERILHRIETRQILSRKEYQKLTGTAIEENDE